MGAVFGRGVARMTDCLVRPAPVYRSGHVVVAGRPNTGKSTLVNAVLGRKLSIVSAKPQTTRWSMLGIKSSSQYQLALIDTPGFQKLPRFALNRYMNRELDKVLGGAELALLVIEAGRWDRLDALVLDRLRRYAFCPIVLVINKIDLLARRDALLEQMAACARIYDFSEIVPVSALRRISLSRLESVVSTCLPCAEPRYPPRQFSDRDESFLAAELIREKLMRRLGDELPYRLTITVEVFCRQQDLLRVSATIWVDNERHKAMIIGKGGSVLRAVGKAGREDMQAIFHSRVHLNTWVKVRKGWFDSISMLRELGYAAD